MAHHEGTNLDVSKEIGSEQIPKSTIAALGKMPGSEGNHGRIWTFASTEDPNM